MASRKINLIDFNTNIYKEDTEQPTGFSSSRVKVEADESDVESNFGAGTQQNASDFSFSEPETENAITIFKLKDEGEPDKSVDIKRESDEDCEEDEEDSEDEALPPAAFVSVVKEERPWTPDSQPCSSKNTSNEPMETNEESPTFSGFSPVPETQDPLLIDSSEDKSGDQNFGGDGVTVNCDGKDVKPKSESYESQSLNSLYEMDPKFKRTPTNVFECHICNYKTDRKWILQGHFKVHNDEDYLRCDKCDFRTKLPLAFKNHKKNHKLKTPFPCDQCTYIARNQSGLKNHKICHSGEKPYSCHFCDYRTERSHHLIRHFEKHINETEKGLFKCKFCDFQHKRKKPLDSHYTNSHPEYKPYECDLCDFKSSSKYSTRSHRESHFPEKKLVCDQCPYATNRTALLRAHLNKHKNQNRFSCKQCDYTAHLKRHIDRHVKKHLKK